MGTSNRVQTKRHKLADCVIPLTFRDDYAAALGMILAGKIRVREMITHRLGMAETGQFFTNR